MLATGADSSQLAVSFECSPVREVHVDECDGSPPEVVVETVADLEGVAPRRLPPLHESVDPDVLTQMVRHHRTYPDSTTALCFTSGGWNVFARANGNLVVGDPEQMTESTPLF